MKGEHRTFEQIREHYEVEKELATRLRNASRQERPCLYSSVYDELFRRIPYHPLLTRKLSDPDAVASLHARIQFLQRFLNQNSVFLEIGPGDCALSVEVAKLVNTAYAVDVSEEVTKRSTRPSNFRLVLSDGCNIPLPTASVDVAYSDQLMEHLHPDDAIEQLQSIHRVLVPGGVYICITPNRLSGPHDVSKNFDVIASGLHLIEYTTTELGDLFMAAGFSKMRAYVEGKGICIRLPLAAIRVIESLIGTLPYSARRLVTNGLPCRLLMRARLIGTK